MFKARGEDTSILGRSQAWAYSNQQFRRSLTIEFHPAARCNFSCQHCQGGPYLSSWGSPAPRMSPDLVRRFFVAYDSRKDTSIGMWRIIISGMTGEPTLNPKVTRLILIQAKERGISMGLSTAGLLLKPEDMEILTSDNVAGDWLNLSVDSPIGSEPRLDRVYQAVHGYRKPGGLTSFMRNLEAVAEMKYRKGSPMQINIDWLISDLAFDPGHIEEDVVATIDYLNRLPGVSLLRLQFPFFLHDQIPGLNDESSTRLAQILKQLQTGEVIIDGLREDLLVKLRNNWYNRLPSIRECTAARDYGVVFGPDGRTYFCPYTAAPAFEEMGALLPHVTADNLWDVIEEIKPLDVEGITRCQMTCILKNCFVDLGIVK